MPLVIACKSAVLEVGQGVSACRLKRRQQRQPQRPALGQNDHKLPKLRASSQDATSADRAPASRQPRTARQQQLSGQVCTPHCCWDPVQAGLLAMSGPFELYEACSTA